MSEIPALIAVVFCRWKLLGVQVDKVQIIVNGDDSLVVGRSENTELFGLRKLFLGYGRRQDSFWGMIFKVEKSQ
jgi:hypothetical protein